MRPQSRPVDQVIAEIAGRQHGVIARRQLLGLGLSTDAIKRRLRRGRLHQLYRGVYAVGHSAPAGRSYFIAAVYACGPDALLSHRSAAELWNLLRSSATKVDVIVPGGGRLSSGRLRVHRTRNLRPEDRAVVDGIPVTSLARTLLDLAAVAPQRQVEQAIEQAEKLGIFDMGPLERVLQRSRGHRGRRRLLAALSEAQHAVHWTRSELEARFLKLCREAGLPRPSVNIWLEDCEVDVAWIEQKLIVELDTWYHHGTAAAFERDRERDTKLQLAEYRVIRVTQRRIERDPAKLVAELRRLLALGAPA